jgi:GNAT superfamily N-acetyltransferase
VLNKFHKALNSFKIINYVLIIHHVNILPDTDNENPWAVQAEPVLPVTNVAETVNYWHEVLGFPTKWMWGEPANIGAVSWNGGAAVQFSLDPTFAAISKGQAVWIRVRNLDSLYALHQQRAKIVTPMRTRPWGYTEYCVEEINGHYIIFTAPSTTAVSQREVAGTQFNIVFRSPSFPEAFNLAKAVGWGDVSEEGYKTQASTAVLSVVAEDANGKAIGVAFLMGDKVNFYYIKDVLVHPDWQRKQVGTLMMRKIMNWLESNARASSVVGLFTGDHLASFYRQFGFIQACGMYRQVKATP